MPDFTLLDNPFWSALATAQDHFASGNELAKAFPPDVLPFAGLRYDDGDLLDLLPGEILEAAEGEGIFVKDGIEVPATWTVMAKLPCIQMIAEDFRDGVNHHDVQMLQPGDRQDLFELVNLVQPGFIKEHTYELGNYYGIKVNGQLVAVAGERMRVTGMIEVSAVCTHPDHTGKGYAQQLVSKVCKEIVAQDHVPYLHVLETNTRAIRLYERLGFTKRMDFPLLKLTLK